MLGITILALAVAIPSIARAHEGHAHKVMGTVTNIAGNHVTVKTTDGKTAMVMLDAKTKITQGKNKVDASALKVGDRVVAEGLEEKEMIVAATLQLGVAQAAAKK
jgi:hypothetical protein